MDPELSSVIKRYTVVGVVLAAAVVWAALYTTDRVRAAGSTSVDALAPRAAPQLTGLQTPGVPAAPNAPAQAPSVASLLVAREGTTRVACAPACRLEAYCGLRDVSTCTAASCEGDLRKAHASDLVFARADTCVQAAAAPCEEACARRGVCDNTHHDDARCTDACLKRAGRDPTQAYTEARCVLESACADLPRCGFAPEAG